MLATLLPSSSTSSSSSTRCSRQRRRRGRLLLEPRRPRGGLPAPFAPQRRDQLVLGACQQGGDVVLVLGGVEVGDAAVFVFRF